MGESVVLGLSGYGSPRSEAASVASEGPLDASEWGDEPAMVRWLAPELPLIVGRRRVLAAELASQLYPNHILLMDDGFQHLPLRKHVTLIIDPESPVNARCLPAGPYREPRRNRRRADLIFGSRFQFVRSPLTFIEPSGTQVGPPKAAAMLCAIGEPDGFAQSLTEAGVRLTTQVRLPDHDPLTAGTLFDGLDRDIPLVVTAKDWVKLRARGDLQDRQIVIALRDLEIDPAAEFRSWLSNQLARVRGS
jgi:tetraacyldisaccharide 4'-kinase